MTTMNLFATFTAARANGACTVGACAIGACLLVGCVRGSSPSAARSSEFVVAPDGDWGVLLANTSASVPATSHCEPGRATLGQLLAWYFATRADRNAVGAPGEIHVELACASGQTEDKRQCRLTFDNYIVEGTEGVWIKVGILEYRVQKGAVLSTSIRCLEAG
jgi:hypothetical protein